MGGFSGTVASSGGSSIVLSDVVPLSESKTPAAGSMNEAVRADHQHPRLSSSTNHVLDANGFVTVTFTRTFDAEPAINLTALGTGTGPIPDFRAEFIKTGPLWTGAIIYGQRNKPLPTLAPVSGSIVLLANLITSLNSLFATLSGFAPYEAAAGAQVSCVVLRTSSV